MLFSDEAHAPNQIILDQTMRSVLRQNSSVPVEIYCEYLDGVRIDPSAFESDLVNLLRRKYEGKKLDLVFTFSVASLKVLLKNRPTLFSDVPLIFLVLDQRDIAGLNLSPHVTGVWGEINLKPNLQLALALHPGTRKVVVVSGSSEWDQYWLNKAREDFRDFERALDFNYLVGLTISEQQNALRALPQDTIVFFLTSRRDNAGNTYDNLDVLRQISSASSVPIYGTTDAQLGLGIVGGNLISYEAIGTEVAKVGSRVLAGENPDAIGPHGVPSVSMFDWRELRRWNISETSLPPGSIVRFKEPSLWGQYEKFILGAMVLIVVLTALLALLLVERRRLRLVSESRRHLAAIVECSDDAIVSKDLDGKILSWNRGAEVMYGYSADEMIGEHVSTLAPPGRKEESSEIIDKVKAGVDVEHFETVRLTKDGRHLDVSLKISPVKDDNGEIIGASIIARDITDRKRIERELIENQTQLAGIIGLAKDSIITVDDEQRILLFNEAAEKTFGCLAADAVGQYLSRFIPRAAHFDHIRRLSETNVTHTQLGFQFDLYGRRKSGEEFPIEASISQLDLNGRMFFTVILRDITERQVAEENLRQSEERFQTMADAAPIMIWMSGIDKGCTYLNKQWLEFTGRTMEQQVGEGWAASVHPEDYATTLNTYISAFDARKRFEMEYRLRRADGEYRWVFDSGTPRFSSGGEFLGYIGSCIDISERKESEQSLQKAHVELRELKNQLEAENIYLHAELQMDHTFGEIVGQSDAIKYVRFKINQVATTDSTVLISGETGTGKELVARAIHQASNRKDRRLITVNCAALAPTLIESELFGHEKGAFTGAATRKIGRFELANGGTIFLDEIGELPLELQVKLLRVIQENELERVGGTKTIKVDVRIIAATNRNLKDEVEAGTFREDLWYRLNVFPITMPPLRQRREDIPALAEHLIGKASKKFGKKISSVAGRSIQRLQAHSWPGNVRELANVIERAVIHSSGSVLQLADSLQTVPEDLLDPPKTLEDMERDYIIRTLENTGWRIDGEFGAAKILGLNPSTLRTRMVKFQIQRRRSTNA